MTTFTIRSQRWVPLAWYTAALSYAMREVASNRQVRNHRAAMGWEVVTYTPAKAANREQPPKPRKMAAALLARETSDSLTHGWHHHAHQLAYLARTPSQAAIDVYREETRQAFSQAVVAYLTARYLVAATTPVMLALRCGRVVLPLPKFRDDLAPFDPTPSAEHGVVVSLESVVGAKALYLAKGAEAVRVAREMALSGTKTGWHENRTHRELSFAAAEGDKYAALRWHEWEQASFGTSALTGMPVVSALTGVCWSEQDQDEDQRLELALKPAELPVVVLFLNGSAWRMVRDRQHGPTTLLDTAERAPSLAAARKECFSLLRGWDVPCHAQFDLTQPMFDEDEDPPLAWLPSADCDDEYEPRQLAERGR